MPDLGGSGEDPALGVQKAVAGKGAGLGVLCNAGQLRRNAEVDGGGGRFGWGAIRPGRKDGALVDRRRREHRVERRGGAQRSAVIRALAFVKLRIACRQDRCLRQQAFLGLLHKLAVVELEEELDTWIQTADPNDAIRVISGGPGSGKSSFAKMFAAKLAAKGTLPVLFIPLHHFEPSDDLIDAVGEFVRMDGILPHNPLAAEQRESRLLIIFDGLDELAMQGKIAERTAQDFVREVQRKVLLFNQRETCLQVLISGRELVVQANETNFRKDGQILHVLPYFVPESSRGRYVDEKKLLKQDQRQLWWQNYGAASGSGYDSLPTELDQGNLIEITTQPLLNYLVALSLRRGELKFSKATNLNAVYADLIKAIHERGWAGHQHMAIQGIEETDFVRILEEIALAAWHGNGRTTTVREIERHCEGSNLSNLLNRFQAGYQPDSKASITRLMTAFYFRQSGHDNSGDKTFEFTHKSFGEYLTARRIVQEVQYIHRRLQDRYNDSYDNWDERSALHRWALVCGASAMDEYLFKFVLDEIHLHQRLRLAHLLACQWQDRVFDQALQVTKIPSTARWPCRVRRYDNRQRQIRCHADDLPTVTARQGVLNATATPQEPAIPVGEAREERPCVGLE